MAHIRVIDENKKMSIMDLTDDMVEKLQFWAKESGKSLEEVALIQMTNANTSRFKGSVEVVLDER